MSGLSKPGDDDPTLASQQDPQTRLNLILYLEQ
jgi:hypothetical protein